MKKLSKAMVMLSVLAILITCMTAVSFAASRNDEISVNFTAAAPGEFDLMYDGLEVKGDMFEKAYPEWAEQDMIEGVSLADVLVAAHQYKYGDKAKDYMGFTLSDKNGVYLTKQFGHEYVGFYYRNKVITDGATYQEVTDGDQIICGSYSDANYADLFGYFDSDELTVTVGEEVKLTLTTGNFLGGDYAQVVPLDEASLKIVDNDGKMVDVPGSIKASYAKGEKDGTFTVTFNKAGAYVIAADGTATYEGWYGTVTGRCVGANAVVYVKDIKPAKPVIRSAKRKSAKKALVVWKKAKNAKKYEVAYRAKGTKKWTVKKTAKTKIALKKLKAGKAYQVKVLAVNGSEKSKYSKIKTIKTK